MRLHGTNRKRSKLKFLHVVLFKLKLFLYCRFIAAKMSFQTTCLLGALLATTLVITSVAANPFDKYVVYCKAEDFRKYVSRSGCDSRYVTVRACLGTCASYALPLSYSPFFTPVCHCCKAVGKEWKNINLMNCSPGVDPLIRLESATSCGCASC